MKIALRRVAVIAMMLVPLPAHADKPYAFRGLPLGVTLDDFRSHEHARALPAGSVAVCTTDPEANSLGMELSGADSVSIACKWAHRTEEGWRPSQAVVDCAPSYDHVLRFAAMPGESEPRLYRMSFVFDARLASDFADALASKYGASRLKREHGYTRRVWENAASSITLEANEGAASARVIYRLKDHEAWLARLTEQWRAAADTP
ncbi:hypothetical protein [Caballeronia sp. ATUFL_M2_KS44]|uniref:hypothetical protein n=1 Tax=Caballeronia sp. ATUFL_M2_KS44 TaxID=2921767 RepID=UPI002028BCA2|nr:hypothetical protein [Caballeronia sp. ATUFL_M2_KS44]